MRSSRKANRLSGMAGISLHEVVVPLAIVTRELHVKESEL